MEKIIIPFFFFCFLFFSDSSVGVGRKLEFSKNILKIQATDQDLLNLYAWNNSIKNNIEDNQNGIKKYEKLISDIETLINRLKQKKDFNQRLSEQEKKKLLVLYPQYLIKGGKQEKTNILNSQLERDLKRSIIKLSRLQKEDIFIKNQLIKNQEKLEEIKGELEEVQSIVQNLFDKKEFYKEKITSQKRNKEKLIGRQSHIISRFGKADLLKANRIQKKITKVVTFSFPVLGILKKKRIDNGIEFLTSDQFVRASSSGKVIFNGDLAGYGQVIIIKHSEELKSVYLGSFRRLVEQGEKVSLNQKIAQFNNISKQSVYFELRKGKSYVQKIPWTKAQL